MIRKPQAEWMETGAVTAGGARLLLRFTPLADRLTGGDESPAAADVEQDFIAEYRWDGEPPSVDYLFTLAVN